jgi:DNA-binding CsgD family transcriptional regulator
MSQSQRRVLACLGAHLASGWRLRQARAEVDDADAVLDSKGQFLHLRDGEPRAERRHLDRAFQTRTHARGALRKVEVMSAMELWRAMVRGEWTLVDHFDTDGKRLVLARRNSPTVPEIGALGKRERQVAAYAAYGFSIKEIGYELGLGASAVSNHLRTALRKLRLKTRGELTALFGREG